MFSILDYGKKVKVVFENEREEWLMVGILVKETKDAVIVRGDDDKEYAIHSESIISSEVITDPNKFSAHNYCSNCGADLSKQNGWNEVMPSWVCTECGQVLTNFYQDDSTRKYPGITWFCDNCGDILDNQLGFSDNLEEWKCAKCGHINPINQDEIINVEEGAL